MEFCGETSRESSSTVLSDDDPCSFTEAGGEEAYSGANAGAPVLFLDVDGVLNTSRGLLMNYSSDDATLYHVSDLLPDAVADSITPLDKHRVANLKSVLEAVPSLCVVISSTWREDPAYMAFLYAALRAGGVDVDAKVLGRTPSRSAGRGAEVREWLALHPSHRTYAIVDDGHADSFKECGLGPRLVQTYIGCSQDADEGLTTAHAQNLIDLFVSER